MSNVEIILAVVSVVLSAVTIVQSVLIYKSLPADKFEKALQQLTELASRTANPNDDVAVNALKAIWAWVLDTKTPPPAPPIETTITESDSTTIS